MSCRVNELKRINSQFKAIDVYQNSKMGTSMSAAPIPQTHEHVHSVQIQRWSCFVDNVSSWTKV